MGELTEQNDRMERENKVTLHRKRKHFKMFSFIQYTKRTSSKKGLMNSTIRHGELYFFPYLVC